MVKRAALGLIAAASLLLCSAAMAGHSNVTLEVDTATRKLITGSVEIVNNVADAQTGIVTIVVFETKKGGRFKEISRLVIEDVDLAAGAGSTTDVDFEIAPKRGKFLKKKTVVLADYTSEVDGVPASHSHASAVSLE